VFAWAFELTPDGLRRDKLSVAEQQIKAPRSAASRKKLDIMIFGAMAVALAYFVFTHDWQGDSDSVVPGEIRSIVVLPLDNLMNDPDQAFFVDGLHEALITELSKITALRVISRTSALHYRDSGKALPEIARELGVDAVVEGSVLRAGETIRVTAQLIEGSTDRHLWADNFDRELTDILALYADVTREIVNQIRVTVTPEEANGLEVSQRVNPEAYELFLKGRYLCNKWGPQEMLQGIELMEQSISLDTQHAQSYAGLARCLQYSAFFNYVSPLEITPRARAAALMAVELDDDLADAHVALSGVRYYLEFRANAAEKELTRALDLEPANLGALIHLAWLLAESGRFDEALKPALRAVQRDPLSIAAHQTMGQMFYLQRDFEQAILAFEKGLELGRNDVSLHQYLAWPYEQMGQYERAIALHKTAVELSQRDPLYLAGLGYSYGKAGMREDALQILEELSQAKAASPYDMAIVHLGLGNYEQAIDWLEKAYDARNSYLVYMDQGPKFDPLRDDDRFIRLLERMER
jgi:TolB-like protein/tetratricopeptide (TPR) repeat protein